MVLGTGVGMQVAGSGGGWGSVCVCGKDALGGRGDVVASARESRTNKKDRALHGERIPW